MPVIVFQPIRDIAILVVAAFALVIFAPVKTEAAQATKGTGA